MEPSGSPAGQDLAVTSFPQQRLWFLSQLPGANAAYNEAMAYHLRGPLDRPLLVRALDALVSRHEALRTRLVSVAGEVWQRIDPPDTRYSLLLDDLTDLPDPEVRLAELQRGEATEPFDLSEGPLARGRLVALGAEHHVLILTVHHTVFDGRSMDVMLRELGIVYTALLRGEDPLLPPLLSRYADYARTQREWAGSDAPDAHTAYWRKQLAGVPPLLALPTDRPRPPEQDYRGGRVAVSLDEDLTTALRALARRQGGTLFVAALAGWSVVLSRLTGQDDLVIGTPTANRRRKDVSGVIGFFVNTLALRVDLSGSPAVGDLLKRVRGMVREALDHQDLPFERVVEVASPPRSAAHTPLLQTVFAWQPSREGLMSLPEIAVDAAEIPYAAAKFDLALSLAEVDGRMTGHLDYAEALFDHDTVERYAGYLRRVLSQMVEHPDRDILDIELMDDAERGRLLADWSAAGGPAAGAPGRPGGLIERFEDQVRIRPAQPALVGGEQLSGRPPGPLDYASLDRRVNRLAHALIARGAGRDQVVALHAGRSTDLVVAVLAILKAGAAYLPLDPDQPAERLAAMVEDAGPVLVLSDAGARRPEGWQDLTAVEAEGVRDDPPGIATDPDQLAYVIYTSGSTGRPKGVAVTHASVLNLFDDWLAHMGATPGEAASAWSSIGFDASVHEILLPLTTGAVLHLVPEDLRGDPGALMGWLGERRIVHAFLPPSYIKWIDEAPAERLGGLVLRRLLTGVEPLPERALHRMEQTLPGLRICYGYGPTEATLYSTAYYDPQPLDRQCPIGRPLTGTRLYLLDQRLRPVPSGVAGEVYLGGASLARGYLHRQDLTDERFVPDPFVPGARMYRTGDLARRLPDGNAEYAGRCDDQVKLRGFRIEPGEIEAALLALPEVREAAVLADRDASGELRLVAGIGRGETAARQPYEWRAALAERLPDYMIPAVFVELPFLPLGRSGKLDRAALLALARESGSSQVNLASPRDHIELTLYRIWQEILLHTDIGVRDSFFDLGGTSLSAIKMAHAIREAFGELLPIRDIILHPTIEALGGRLRRGAPVRPPSSLIEFRAGDGRQRVVCVHPAGGTAFCYLSLAKALPESCGVYGIQSPGVNPGESFLPSVEAMAEAYLELIEPLGEGPLVLSGLSYGGLVAHAMARRLAAAGKTDVSVVLLDTQATDDPAERAALAPVDLDDFRDKLIRFNGMYPGIEDEQIDRYFRVYNHNRMTARDHVPAPTTARTVLVQAAEGSLDTPQLSAVRAFWNRRAEGGFLVEQVDCDHWEILESDQVPRVAAVLENELVRWDGPAPAPVLSPSAPSAGPRQDVAPAPRSRS